MRTGHALALTLVLLAATSLACQPGRKTGRQEAPTMRDRERVVITWPAPTGEQPSEDYRLAVNHQPVFVHQARVREEVIRPPGSIATHQFGGKTEWASFAIFDFAEPVEAVVEPRRPFRTASIHPLSLSIKPTIEGATIRFRLDRPRQVTVMLDSRDDRPLHLFTNRPETDVPRPDDPDVIYFGPGTHETGPIAVRSDQTVYLAGGAVVKGVILPEEKGIRNERTGLVHYSGPTLNLANAQNVRIRGRGILDGSRMPHGTRGLIGIHNCRNVDIQGIVLRDSPAWNITIWGSSDVRVEGVKQISGRLNSDGINSVGSHHVRIADCFVRNHDDSIVVKTTVPETPAFDIDVANCVIWNDWGFALGVTYETRADVRDVVFRDCDILFTRHHVLGIHVSDSGTIGPVRFDDIRIEDLALAAARFGKAPNLFRIAIGSDMWGTDPQRGHIRDITFRRVTYAGAEPLASQIHGADAQHRVENVTFEEVVVAGRKATDAASANLAINEHTANIQFRP